MDLITQQRRRYFGFSLYSQPKRMDRLNDITSFRKILWYNSRDFHLSQVAFESRDIGIFPLVTRGEID